MSHSPTVRTLHVCYRKGGRLLTSRGELVVSSLSSRFRSTVFLVLLMRNYQVEANKCCRNFCLATDPT